MSPIRGKQSDIIDSIARNIISAADQAEKEKLLLSFKDVIETRSRKEILNEKDVLYRRWFTGLVIGIYVTTNVLIGYLVLRAFHIDINLYEHNLEKYSRLIDGKVVIALITGVVVQTATSFGILTKYVYHKDEVKKKDEVKSE